jgi:hypothetical protein
VTNSLAPKGIEALRLTRSLSSTKAECAKYKETQRESRDTSGNGDVVSGREWGNMTPGEVGLDIAGSASEASLVGHRCVTSWALGTW